MHSVDTVDKAIRGVENRLDAAIGMAATGIVSPGDLSGLWADLAALKAIRDRATLAVHTARQRSA